MPGRGGRVDLLEGKEDRVKQELIVKRNLQRLQASNSGGRERGRKRNVGMDVDMEHVWLASLSSRLNKRRREATRFSHVESMSKRELSSKREAKAISGDSGESNSGPPAPEAGIIPLDHDPDHADGLPISRPN